MAHLNADWGGGAQMLEGPLPLAAGGGIPGTAASFTKFRSRDVGNRPCLMHLPS